MGGIQPTDQSSQSRKPVLGEGGDIEGTRTESQLFYMGLDPSVVFPSSYMAAKAMVDGGDPGEVPVMPNELSVLLDPCVAVTLEFYAKRVLQFALACGRNLAHSSPSGEHCTPHGMPSDTDATNPMASLPPETALAVSTGAYTVFNAILSSQFGISATSFLPSTDGSGLPIPLSLTVNMARLVGLALLSPPPVRAVSYIAASEALTGSSLTKSSVDPNPIFPSDWLLCDATQDLIVALRTQAFLLSPQCVQNTVPSSEAVGHTLTARSAVNFPKRLADALACRTCEIYNARANGNGEMPYHITHEGFIDDAKTALHFLFVTFVGPIAVLENLLHSGIKLICSPMDIATASAQPNQMAGAAPSSSGRAPYFDDLAQSSDQHYKSKNIRNMRVPKSGMHSPVKGMDPDSTRTKYPDRNIWSKEEEEMLEEGMREFGARYSTILAVYGPNGSRNNVLGNRNQIQLKDKARNMRLRRERAGLDPGPFIHGIKYSAKKDRNAARNASRRRRRDMSDKSMCGSDISSSPHYDMERGGSPMHTGGLGDPSDAAIFAHHLGPGISHLSDTMMYDMESHGAAASVAAAAAAAQQAYGMANDDTCDGSSMDNGRQLTSLLDC